MVSTNVDIDDDPFIDVYSDERRCRSVTVADRMLRRAQRANENCIRIVIASSLTLHIVGSPIIRLQPRK